MKRLPLLFTLLLGCGAAEDDPVAVADAASPPPMASLERLSVIDTIAFTREPSPGVARGFDVDGRASDEDDAQGCGKADQISPEGTPGIDNQLATLVPLFELAGIGAAEGLLQGALRNGGLILLIQLDGVDDLDNDDDVTLRIRTGAGIPLLGTDALPLAGQTFAIAGDSPETAVEHARIVDGRIEAGPFDGWLPAVVFGMRYQIALKDARLTARLTWDGGLEDGLLGGGVPLADLIAIGETAAKDDGSVLTAIKAIFASAGDLAPDASGACQQVSAALAFTGVSAFLYSEGTPSE